MISTALGLLVLGGLLIVAVKFYRLTSYWRRRGVPYESFLSSIYTNLVRYRREDVYAILEEFDTRYGSVYGTFNGFQPVLRVSSPAAISDALVRCFSSNHERTLFVPTGSPIWDNNILVLDYQRWKTVRHLSGLAFTSAKLKPMKSKIERVANRLVDRLTALADGSDVDPLLYAQGFTLDVIAAVAFSLELDAIGDPTNAFVRFANSVFGPSLGLSVLLTMPSLVRYLPFVNYPPKDVSDFFGGFTSTIINERRSREGHAVAGDPDVLDLWLAEQKVRPDLTDELIASQAFVFFVAGFETSAYTLQFTLFLLSVNADVQQLAYDDMTTHADDLDNVTFEEYSRMKFIEACLLETLRLYTTDYVLDRRTVSPCEIGGVPLDAGIGVHIPVPAVHRNADLFPEPFRYRPQRFVAELNPYSVDSATQLSTMMTFGDGPKGCMGRRLALLQLTIGLCAILKRLRVIRSERVATAPEGQLAVPLMEGAPFLPPPKQPLYVRFTERTRR